MADQPNLPAWAAKVTPVEKSRKLLNNALQYLPKDNTEAAFIRLWEALLPSAISRGEVGAKHLIARSLNTSDDGRQFEITARHALAGEFNAAARQAVETMARELGITHKVNDPKKAREFHDPDITVSIASMKSVLKPILATEAGSEKRHTAVEQFWMARDQTATEQPVKKPERKL